MLQDGPGGAEHGEVQPRQLHGLVRPHRNAVQLLRARGARGLSSVQGATIAGLGASRTADRRATLTVQQLDPAERSLPCDKSAAEISSGNERSALTIVQPFLNTTLSVLSASCRR